MDIYQSEFNTVICELLNSIDSQPFNYQVGLMKILCKFIDNWLAKHGVESFVSDGVDWESIVARNGSRDVDICGLLAATTPLHHLVSGAGTAAFKSAAGQGNAASTAGSELKGSHHVLDAVQQSSLTEFEEIDQYLLSFDSAAIAKDMMTSNNSRSERMHYDLSDCDTDSYHGDSERERPFKNSTTHRQKRSKDRGPPLSSSSGHANSSKGVSSTSAVSAKFDGGGGLPSAGNGVDVSQNPQSMAAVKRKRRHRKRKLALQNDVKQDDLQMSDDMMSDGTLKVSSQDAGLVDGSKDAGTPSRRGSHPRVKVVQSPCKGSISAVSRADIEQIVTDGVKLYKCPECTRPFRSYSHLQRHLQLHYGIRRFKCDNCGLKFSRSEHLKRHMEKRHSCSRTEKSDESAPTESQLKHACQLCQSRFRKNVELKQHMKAEHPSEPRPPKPMKVKSRDCPLCNKPFEKLRDMKAHVLADHPEAAGIKIIPKRQCSECGEMFPTLALLRAHLATFHVGFKPFMCSECGQQFMRQDHLERHLRLHSGEKPFMCNLCASQFSRADHLRRHLRLHAEEKAKTAAGSDKPPVAAADVAAAAAAAAAAVAAAAEADDNVTIKSELESIASPCPSVGGPDMMNIHSDLHPSLYSSLVNIVPNVVPNVLPNAAHMTNFSFGPAGSFPLRSPVSGLDYSIDSALVKTEYPPHAQLIANINHT